MAKGDKLTPKQERFSQEYVLTGNGAASYKEVYKCSEKAAESGASRTLRIDKVAKYVQKLKEKTCKKAEVSIASVIGMITDTHRRAKEDGSELNVELKAADMLAKHVGAYEKDNEQAKIVIEKPLTEQELQARLAVITQAGDGIDTSSIG